MTTLELRKKFIAFFKSKGHVEISGASLIPENDPTVLFTTAGMHPLVPFLLGEKHPAGKLLTNYQKCIRTGDIDLVGDDWHLTFFEMLGNWSLGDYSRKQAIEWSWEFLTNKNWLGIPPEKLYVSVFAGDQNATKDSESIKIWRNLFKKVNIAAKEGERIFCFGKKDNWWGPAGQNGPCGPTTEMFYDTGKKKCSQNCDPSCDCGKYNEIWNDVFLEYNKTALEKFEKLKQKNIDTGLGLERTIAVLNGRNNAFDINLFTPVIKKIDELSKKDDPKAKRIIADHVRAACFILADGIVPSNLDQGYVLRRLIRRAMRHAKILEMKDSMTEIAKIVFISHAEMYPEIKDKKKFILNEIQKEEDKFKKTLVRGLKEFRKLKLVGQAGRMNKNTKAFNRVSAKKAFAIYQTYGFPLEMIEEELANSLLVLDKQEFAREFKKHQELSRKGAEKKFAGGLADHAEQTTKLHTATHLLHAALRKVLGNHVKQNGSNITAERLRFDFSHPEKMTEQQIKQVEDMINEQIQKNLPVNVREMSFDDAKKQGAIGLFAKKYGEKVKVYAIGDFSLEICGGPHVKNTKKLGKFFIKKEQASSAGIRRIKASLITN